MMRADKSTLHFAGPKSKDRDWFGDQEFPWLSLHARVKTGKTMADAQAELAVLQNPAPRAAETTGPKKFISVAPAFGAGKTESFRTTMAIAGGATGILLARWSVELLFPWVFARSSGRIFAKTALSLTLDWRVLVFAMSLSLLSSVAFGVAPALRATRPDLVPVINGGHVAFGGRSARSWLRNGLVVAQVALCFVLLIPAGLLIRALTKAGGADRGYAANKLLVVEYSRKFIEKGAPVERLFQQQLMSRLAALPGVQSVCPQTDSGGQVRIILPDERGPGGQN